VTAPEAKYVRVRRVERFRHEATVRQHIIAIDEPASLGGDDTAASPLDLLAASVAACTAATVEMYAQRKGWQLGEVEVEVVFTPPPARGQARFEVLLTLPSKLDDWQIERLEQIARKSPVRRTFASALFVDRVEVDP
jgi:putative redox protein